MSFEEDKCRSELFETIRRSGVRINGASGRKNNVWLVGNKKIRIQYSKLHRTYKDKNGTDYDLKTPYYFFGVPKDVFNGVEYILFICGTTEQRILVPTQEFVNFSKNVPLAQDQTKVHIFSSYGKFELSLTGKGRIDVTNYIKNEFELIKTLKSC